MKHGVFAEDFSNIFDEVLGDLFEFGFPPNSGNAPNPNADVEAPTLPTSLPSEVPIDEFDLVLPVQASSTASDHAPLSSEAPVPSAVNFAPLYSHRDGHAGGGPGGGSDGGPGGGGPGGGGPGGGGGNTPSTITYTSGLVDFVDLTTGEKTDYFNMSIGFYGDDYASGTAAALKSYVEAAADFISSLIATGLHDDPNMFYSWEDGPSGLEVDDIHIEIYIDSIKGKGAANTLAATDVYAANDWDQNWNGNILEIESFTETPAGATITFNSKYIDGLEASGTLDDVVLHEMLHTLYFGLWGTAENTLVSGGVYNGTNANLYSGDATLSAEGDGEGFHWSESAHGDELMTTIAETTDIMTLEYYSIASLMDLAIIDASEPTGDSDAGRGYDLVSTWTQLVDDLNGAEAGIDLIA